jgi:methionine-rich copper-binding protein CopC
MRLGGRGSRVLAGGVACVAALILTASPAVAHSEPVELSPDDGASLSEAPTQVRAVFSEELDAESSLTVFDSAGRPVGDAGHLDLDDVEHVTLVADIEVGSGSYTVEWTAVSAEDGDATSGSWAFTVGDAPDGGVAPIQTTDSGGLDVLAVVAGLGVAAAAVGLTVVFARHRRVPRVSAVE